MTDNDATSPTPMDYMEGLCHVLAVAIHRERGTGFLLLVDDADLYPSGVPAVIHVYARPGDGTLIDAMGIHDEADTVAQWLDTESGECAVRILEDESELAEYVGPGFEHPLSDYADDDVERSSKVMQAALDKVAAGHARSYN
jgi:hypothetical protein